MPARAKIGEMNSACALLGALLPEGLGAPLEPAAEPEAEATIKVELTTAEVDWSDAVAWPTSTVM